MKRTLKLMTVIHSVIHHNKARHSRESGNPERHWIPPYQVRDRLSQARNDKLPKTYVVMYSLIFLLFGCTASRHEIQLKTWGEPFTGMEFVFVNGGCFMMGDTFSDGYEVERPVHEVCVNGFWMGKYEVTQGQWEKVMGTNPSHIRNGHDYPVETVNWDDAQEFVRKLNQITGKGFRLPTEAEWEYAARSGGKKEKWAGTNKESELGEYAWYVVNSGVKTHPVGQKRANGLGLYDMSGNVWEWVRDWYDKDYYKESPRDNPVGPNRLRTYRAVRGGSCYDGAQNVRTSNRSGAIGPRARNPFTGFRLVFAAQ
jgi:formylglycine-generating enzyme required for sulfatase activity